MDPRLNEPHSLILLSTVLCARYGPKVKALSSDEVFPDLVLN